jgi:Zn-finger nucleic acid-binding protein
MLSYQHDGLEVDSCPECFGLWFDREELKEFLQRPELAHRLSEVEPQALTTTPRHAIRLCPGCQNALSETSLGEVLVDFCSRCRGIWLDQGELDRAVEQYRQGQRGNLVVLNQIAEGLRAARKDR